MLKPIGTNNLPDADNKTQTLIGQVSASFLKALELFADFGIIDRFFPQERIEFKLFPFYRAFQIDEIAMAVFL